MRLVIGLMTDRLLGCMVQVLKQVSGKGRSQDGIKQLRIYTVNKLVKLQTLPNKMA